VKQTHITYATAKALKEFCPELPEPMEDKYNYQYGKSGKLGDLDLMGEGSKALTKIYGYKLHDLLSREFCEKMALKIEPLVTKGVDGFLITHIATKIFGSYFNDGLPAVEAELMRMMDGK